MKNNNPPQPKPNDQKANVKNPNNPAHKQNNDNRSNQKNPTHNPSKGKKQSSGLKSLYFKLP